MLGTSSSNIEKILIQNRCGSLADINKKKVVRLELYHLSGYLDLSEFTQGAVELRIINSVPQNPKWKNMWYEDANKEELELANEKKDLIILDARNAGDFSYWITDDCRNYHFIEKIILRHPNQVFSFGIRPGFPTQNSDLGDLFQIAKTKSRDTNINRYRRDKSFAPFKNNLDIIQTNLNEISATNADINVLIEKKREMEENIKYLRTIKIAGHQEKIATQINVISDKNATSQNKIQIQDIQLLDNYWKSETHTNTDSAEQHYQQKVISTSELDALKIRNREFYSKQRYKQR